MGGETKYLFQRRHELQELLREVIVLNTDVGEAATVFEKRFRELEQKGAKLWGKIEEKLDRKG